MKLPPLANAELGVMELLWNQGTLTARSIREQLYPAAERAQHGTVQSLLQRLEDKGFIERDRSLAVHLFSAKVSQEAYVSNQLESLTKRLTGGSLAPLITHLMEHDKIPPEEIERLRRILDQKDRQGDDE